MQFCIAIIEMFFRLSLTKGSNVLRPASLCVLMSPCYAAAFPFFFLHAAHRFF